MVTSGLSKDRQVIDVPLRSMVLQCRDAPNETKFKSVFVTERFALYNSHASSSQEGSIHVAVHDTICTGTCDGNIAF